MKNLIGLSVFDAALALSTCAFAAEVDDALSPSSKIRFTAYTPNDKFATF
jgi:hypothetical protein